MAGSVAYTADLYDKYRKDGELYAPKGDLEVFEWIGNWKESPPEKVAYQDYTWWHLPEVRLATVRAWFLVLSANGSCRGGEHGMSSRTFLLGDRVPPATLSTLVNDIVYTAY